jgi:hypothetical protein
MKFFRSSLTLAVIFIACAGCAAIPTEETGAEPETQEAALSSWSKVTSCDQDAMVVDVKGYPQAAPSAGDPSYPVQAVVRSQAIVDYLEAHGALTRNPSNASEAIIPGQIWLSTFRGPFDGSFFGTTNTGADVSLTRYGQGINLRFTITDGRWCPSFCTTPSDPEYDPTSGICEGCSSSSGTREIASWWFADCPVLANIYRR